MIIEKESPVRHPVSNNPLGSGSRGNDVEKKKSEEDHSDQEEPQQIQKIEKDQPTLEESQPRSEKRANNRDTTNSQNTGQCAPHQRVLERTNCATPGSYGDDGQEVITGKRERGFLPGK
ncbi:MAG: hypothetical protein ACQGVC_05845 [Myxococcota bacterium]